MVTPAPLSLIVPSEAAPDEEEDKALSGAPVV